MFQSKHVPAMKHVKQQQQQLPQQQHQRRRYRSMQMTVSLSCYFFLAIMMTTIMTLQMIPMASSFVIPQIRQRQQQYGQVLIQRRRHDSFLQDSHGLNMESSSIVIVNNNHDDDIDRHVNITIQVPQYYCDDNSNNNHNHNNNKKKSHDYPSLLHNIHVEPLLSLTEAATCLELAKRYGQDTGKWNTPDYQRHTNYATCDFSVLMDHDENGDNDTHTNGAPELHSYLMNDLDFQSRIFTRLSQAYNVDYDDLLGFIDLFCVNYVAKNGNGDDFEEDDDENDYPNDINNNDNDQTMDRLEAHRDGSILSFTVLLTPPDEFEGGGTFFDALRLNGGSKLENDGDESQRQSSSSTTSYNNIHNYIVQHDHGIVRPPAAGYTVMHCGKLLHGADRVTRGHRTVLVGFVDVADWAICDGVERRACTTFGRMDVAERRAQLQLQQMLKLTQEESAPTSNNHHDTNNHDNFCPRLHRGWSARRSARFLPKTSCFNRIIPAFDTALQRADPEFQRKTRLQAEDLLLRTILVEEKSEFLQRILSSGHVSVL